MENEIQNFNRSNLKSTKTKITYLNGKKCLQEIYNDSDKEEIIELQTATSVGYIIQIEPDLTCDEIIPNLYLSGDDVAQNLQLLKSKSITHILNLTTNIPNLYINENIVYKRFIIYDLPTQTIAEYFNEAFEFIDNALLYNKTKNNLLVHCNAGVSRSASFVIAYLLKRGIFQTYLDSYRHVKECRGKICPNDGFVLQLKEYAKQLWGNVKA